MRLPALLLVLAATCVLPVSAAETEVRCTDATDGNVGVRVCMPQPVTGDFKVDLPAVLPPVVTDGVQGLGFTLALPAPPPATVVIPEKDLATLRPPAAFPVIALVPPVPPAPPAAPPLPALPPATAPTEAAPPAVATMPVGVLEAALRRLRAGSRITDQEADDVLAFYAAREFRPLWLDGTGWGQRAHAVRAALALAAEDGMDPARYRSVAQFIPVREPQWSALAAAEAQLTESVVLYAREAATGRIRPGLINPLITPRLRHETAAKVLARLVETSDLSAAIAGFHPPHAAYRALRTALARLREAARASQSAAAEGGSIPDGPLLRLGMRDPRVPLIRARLGMGYDSTAVYDRRVSIRIAGLQRANGLPVTGAFTAQTRRVLTGEAPSAEEAEIIANMEFWRWMPRDLGEEHILVNTPAYDMSLWRDGRVAHSARTIVGKIETQTPFFSDVMDHIVVNPSWYIPPGILEREPKYLDPAYAAARGYEIRTRGKITTVRVPPGSANALGYVKFMFPNEHAVYLHDTPNRNLFGARNRTLSNGCVRVENPMQLAALLFEAQGMTEARFRQMQGGAERRMNLPRKMPVHLAYFTLTVAQDGTLTRHPDVYGHALRLRQLLGLS